MRPITLSLIGPTRAQNAQAGQAALMAVQAANVQKQIDFTRENEQEADRIGMQILSASDFDPRSMPTFFERMQQSTQFYGQSVPEFLRTHPVTVSRISDSQGRADQYPYKQYPDSMNYLLVKAKLRALTSKDTVGTLRYFQTFQTQGTQEQRAVARYGEALVDLKMQNFSAAEKILTDLVARYPQESHYLNALAKCSIEAKQYDKGLKLYQKALKQFPANNALKVDYTISLLKAGRPALALQVLQSLGASFQEHTLYLELLAQTYGDLKQPAESHRYLAEYYYAVGQTKTAVMQIQLAQKVKPLSMYLKAILDERLHFFMEEEKLRRESE